VLQPAVPTGRRSQYLDGLFNDSERKSMQAMHGRLGDPGQYQALQHFITHSPWDAARVDAELLGRRVRAWQATSATGVVLARNCARWARTELFFTDRDQMQR
jgi:SRSO17 transposase